MAVDTRAKRFSMLGFGASATDWLTDPDTNGVSEAERLDFLDLYRPYDLQNEPDEEVIQEVRPRGNIQIVTTRETGRQVVRL